MSTAPSKRRAVASRAASPGSNGSIGPYACALPPSCDLAPQSFSALAAFEEHYHLQHAHVCDQCTGIFPSEWLLECHIEEVHSELNKERRARGSPAFPCLQAQCSSRFQTCSERRQHAIDAHGFHPDFYFDVVCDGIADLLKAHGPAVSLILTKEPESERVNSLATATSPNFAPNTTRPKRGRTSCSSDSDGIVSCNSGDGLCRIQGRRGILPPGAGSQPVKDDMDTIADHLGTLQLVPPVLRKLRRETRA